MTECRVCGADVKSCNVTTRHDGATVYAQPVKYSEKADGARIIEGGLVHVEGGIRCLSDAPPELAARISKLLYTLPLKSAVTLALAQHRAQTHTPRDTSQPEVDEAYSTADEQG